jgi:hypothetical protein
MAPPNSNRVDLTAHRHRAHIIVGQQDGTGWRHNPTTAGTTTGHQQNRAKQGYNAD